MEENGGGDYSYFEFIYFVLYFVNSIVTVGSVFGNVGGGGNVSWHTLYIICTLIHLPLKKPMYIIFNAI